MTLKNFIAGLATLALALAPMTALPDSHEKGEHAEGKREAVEAGNPQQAEDSTKGQERAAENAGKKADGEEAAGEGAAEEAAPE